MFAIEREREREKGDVEIGVDGVSEILK